MDTRLNENSRKFHDLKNFLSVLLFITLAAYSQQITVAVLPSIRILLYDAIKMIPIGILVTGMVLNVA